MTNLAKAFQEIVERRRSVRIYDEDADFDPSVVRRCLEAAVLAPNSSNLQLWEFYQIQSKDKKDKMATYCLNQPAAKTANELVVFVTRKDLYKKRCNWNLSKIEDSFRKEGVDVSQSKKTKDVGNILQNTSTDKLQRLKSVQQYYGSLIPQLYKNDAFGLLGRIRQLYVTLFMAPKKPAYREVLKSDIDVIVHKSAALAAQTFMLAMASERHR